MLDRREDEVREGSETVCVWMTRDGREVERLEERGEDRVEVGSDLESQQEETKSESSSSRPRLKRDETHLFPNLLQLHSDFVSRPSS